MKKNQKTHYVKYNYAKKDAVNLIENKTPEQKETLEATKESTEIKNLYQNENQRLKKEADGYSSAPSFMKDKDDTEKK